MCQCKCKAPMQPGSVPTPRPQPVLMQPLPVGNIYRSWGTFKCIYAEPRLYFGISWLPYLESFQCLQALRCRQVP